MVPSRVPQHCHVSYLIVAGIGSMLAHLDDFVLIPGPLRQYLYHVVGGLLPKSSNKEFPCIGQKIKEPNLKKPKSNTSKPPTGNAFITSSINFLSLISGS